MRATKSNINNLSLPDQKARKRRSLATYKLALLDLMPIKTSNLKDKTAERSTYRKIAKYHWEVLGRILSNSKMSPANPTSQQWVAISVLQDFKGRQEAKTQLQRPQMLTLRGDLTRALEVLNTARSRT